VPCNTIPDPAIRDPPAGTVKDINLDPEYTKRLDRYGNLHFRRRYERLWTVWASLHGRDRSHRRSLGWNARYIADRHPRQRVLRAEFSRANSRRSLKRHLREAASLRQERQRFQCGWGCAEG
jgi:hypothetical protein